MFTWLAARITPPLDDGITKIMREAFAFEPVLRPGDEFERNKFILSEIVRRSYIPEDRVVIMDHLHYALCPETEWRTIFNGFRVLTALMDNGGSPDIFSELLQGKHFDVTQKTLFLTQYTNDDPRVGKLVSTIAQQVRGQLLIKFSEEPKPPPFFGHTEDEDSPEIESPSIPPPDEPLLDLL